MAAKMLSLYQTQCGKRCIEPAAPGIHEAFICCAVLLDVLSLVLLLLVQGASLHALWQLEVELLRRFDVASFQSLQLPAGCSTLLSALAAQDELAAALTGYTDAWDCGAVAYEDVMRVVSQAVNNLKHGHHRGSRGNRPGLDGEQAWWLPTCTAVGTRVMHHHV